MTPSSMGTGRQLVCPSPSDSLPDALAIAMDAEAMRASPDEDALLREALAFIGDLDFDVDATVDEEEDEPKCLLWGETCGALQPPVAAPSVVSPSMLPQAVPEAPACRIQESNLEASKQEIGMAAFLAPQAWPDVADGKPKVVNRTRNRRRQELLYLRNLVGDLEERLTRLRSVPDQSACDSSSGASDEPNELVSAWEQVATRQYKQREQAEMENIKLRRLLQDQIQVGKSLERILLKKRPNLEAIEPGYNVEKRLRRSNSHSWDKEGIYDELLADCARLYADTDRVVAKLNSIPTAKPIRNVQLVHDGDLGMTVQTTEHRIVPFSFEDTAEVIWASFPDISSVHRFHEYHDVNLTEDTMKLQFRVSSEVQHVSADFSVKIATRRYVEADRIVIVISGLFNPTEVFQTNMKGVRMRHSGWHVIERMPAEGTSTRAGTKLLTHHRSVPEVDDDLLDQTRKVGTLTNFLMNAISIEMESRNQNLDNRLLELSLNGRSADA